MPIEKIKSAIRDVHDFPEPGIVFKDISPILQDPELFRSTINIMSDNYMQAPPDRIIAIDARGFIFGSALAYKLGCGMSMLRKKGKLPYETVGIEYDLEYGSNAMELHTDAIDAGNRVLLVDDVLATGGTAEAAISLIHSLNAEVIALSVLMELSFLEGRKRVDVPIDALIIT